MPTSRFVVAAFGLLCAACPTRGSGTKAEETREIAAFDHLEVSSSIDVFVRAGAAPSARVVGDDNIIPLVSTEVVGDTLEVKTTGSFISGDGIEVHLTTPTLARIEVSGSADVQAFDLASDELVLELSGAGDLVASGTADELAVVLSGAGDLDATGLTAKDVEATLSGAGDAKVTATSRLQATVSGAGDIRYAGDPPDVEKTVSGAGSVEPI